MFSVFLFVIGFVDDNPTKIGKSLEGIPVYRPEIALSKKFTEKNRVRQMILAIQGIDSQKKKQIVEKGLELNIEVKAVPPYENWINGELSAKQLRSVQIDELLGREPIEMDNKAIENNLKGKTVLITGAAGSIGSEIARQAMDHEPSRMMLLDHSEFNLYQIDKELRLSAAETSRVVPLLMDLKEYDTLSSKIKEYAPEVILHAAAYKHVHLVEANPYSSILNNVQGKRCGHRHV